MEQEDVFYRKAEYTETASGITKFLDKVSCVW